MGKISNLVDEYITEVERISGEKMMSDIWRRDEYEQARRLLVKQIKLAVETFISDPFNGLYDSQAASDAVDGVHAKLEEGFKQL